MSSLQSIFSPISSGQPCSHGFSSSAPLAKPSLSLPSRHLFFNSATTTTNNADLHKHLSLFPNPSASSFAVLEEEIEEELDHSGHAGSIARRMVRGQKLLSELSSWGIGGPCDLFLEISHLSHLLSAIRYCDARDIPFIVIGKGSNCLFADRGFDGLVLLNRLDQPAVEVIRPGAFRVASGYPFNRLGAQLSAQGFSGLEFAAGVPATVGGATFMNAGADGQETGDVIESVEMVTRDGNMRLTGREKMAFGYRWSSFQEMEDLAAILAVTFCLTPAACARERQKAFLDRRRKSQPIGERSAGSVFRNPVGAGISAGELIELAGLKGFAMGGAMVSEVHSNFFINFNGSTAEDMLALISFVKERVFQKFGIELKEEIRYVPYSVASFGNKWY